VDTAGSKIVSQAGAALLTDTVGAVGLDKQLSTALAGWRHPNARHDPAKIVLDLAVTLALGGDCLADIALLRAEPALVRAGRLGTDRVTHDRPARPGCHRGAAGDQHRAGRGPRPGLAPGRRTRPRPRHRRRQPG
jgi:hypothetical protein